MPNQTDLDNTQIEDWIEQLKLLKRERDALKDFFPAPPSALTGTITSTGFGYLAEQVAYQALKEAAAQIVARLTPEKVLPVDAKILIVDSLDFASSDLALVQVQTGLDSYMEKLNHKIEEIQTFLQPEPPTPALVAEIGLGVAAISLVPEVIGLAANIASYLRSDYTVAKVTISTTPMSQALSAAIAEKLNTDQRYVVLLNFYTLGDPAASPLLERLTGLRAKSIQLNLLGQKLNALQVPATQADAQKMISKKGQLSLEATALVTEFTAFEKAITTPALGQPRTMLDQAILRKWVQASNFTHLLYLPVFSSGGDVITPKSLWGSGDTSYVAGVIVGYFLAKLDGDIVASGISQKICALDYHLSGNQNNKIRSVEVLEQA